MNCARPTGVGWRMQAASTSASGSKRRGTQSREQCHGSPEALMEAFLDGDARALERLYRQLAPRLLGDLVHMSGDALLAEYLTQTVFLKLYRSRGAYQRGMSVMPWVFAIARNTYIDHQRHSSRCPERLSSDGVLPEPDPEDQERSDGTAP